MDIDVKAEIQEDNIHCPSKRSNMALDIKAQIGKDVKPKLEADIKIKIEPSEEFDESMEISQGGLISESLFTMAQISKNGCQITTLSIFLAV